MGTPCPNRSRRRAGFTLIELMVAIAIIGFIAGMLILIGPVLVKSERASRGAQTLQGVLFIAKQQALRDRNPYGIRLLRVSNDSTSPDYYRVKSFQYIQQPGDFTGGSVMVDPTKTMIFVKDVDLSGGLGNDQTLYPVQGGDFIQIGTDPYNKIKNVTITGPNTSTITLANILGYNGSSGTTWTSQYRIARSPRPVAGEDTIFLPDDVIVDLSLFDPNQLYNAQTNPYHSNVAADPVTGYLDILFTPSGALQGGVGGAQPGKIILWVRDVDPTSPNNPASPGDQTLITIFIRTGQIAAYPVDTSDPSNPNQAFSFTLDPRAGGL